MTAAATSLRTQWDALVDDVLNLFANVLFAVSLFAVWGVLTLIGVIVDQGKDPSVYLPRTPPASRGSYCACTSTTSTTARSTSASSASFLPRSPRARSAA